MCKGASPETLRMSFEYITSSGNLYGCYGACNVNCQNLVGSGVAHIYVR